MRPAKTSWALAALASCAVLAPRAGSAQSSAPEAATGRGASDAGAPCARYLYSALRPIALAGARWATPAGRGARGLSRRYAVYRAQQRAILAVIARAGACSQIRRELRVVAAEGASRRLREWPEGQIGRALAWDWQSRCPDADVTCRPRHPDVARLRPVYQGVERARSYYRVFLVEVVDGLAVEPSLVPAAQLLWTCASWDYGPPSQATFQMLADLRAGTVRTEGAYPFSARSF